MSVRVFIPLESIYSRDVDRGAELIEWLDENCGDAAWEAIGSSTDGETLRSGGFATARYGVFEVPDETVAVQFKLRWG